MNWLRKRGTRAASIREAELLLGSWRLIASSDGRLVMQPKARCLAYGDVRTMCDRLCETSATSLFVEVVVDLELVSSIAAPWTPVFALLVDLARRLAGRCRVVGLHGQPAAAADLLMGGCRLTVLSFEYAVSAPTSGQYARGEENNVAA